MSNALDRLIDQLDTCYRVADYTLPLDRAAALMGEGVVLEYADADQLELDLQPVGWRESRKAKAEAMWDTDEAMWDTDFDF